MDTCIDLQFAGESDQQLSGGIEVEQTVAIAIMA
jgi:hypothetical protein